MIVNNYEAIDDVLKDLFASVKDRDVDLTGNMVYEYLIKMNVNPDERDRDLGREKQKRAHDNGWFGYFLTSDNFFGRWINRFRNTNNINVFWGADWTSFCRFENGNVSSKCIKMYIPLDYDHIYAGANKIFDFLASNNIQHHSKISSMIRFDDIVVRLGNRDDAQKLQRFIDNDQYIKEGLIESNPFAFGCNGISYAFDNMSSYNSCVANLISSYINFMVKDRMASIRNINVRSFYNFIDLCSKDSTLMDEMLSKYSGNCYDGVTTDSLYIVSLLKKSMESNKIEDFYKFTDFAFNEKIYDEVDLAVVNDEKVNMEEVHNNYNLGERGNKQELFNELILTTMKKYSDGYAYLGNFFDGNIMGVTRTNNLRERVANNLSLNDVREIVLDSQLPGYSYEEKLVNYVEVVMLNEMIKCSSKKFPGHGLGQVSEFIYSNNNVYITNSVGEARRLSYNLDASRIKSLFKRLGVRDVYEYGSSYYNLMNEPQKARSNRSL